MDVIFLGPPGAGKGTQARLLSQRLGIPHISTGDILRAAAARGSPLGVEAARYVAAGELVPDAVMIGLVAERLQQPDAAAGFILDGFPRTIAQAEALDAVLAGMGRRVDRVILFKIGEASLIRRLANRRVCQAAGHIYNLVGSPPAQPGICDVDGSPLEFRDDDRPETVQRRLQVYRDLTEPVLAFFQARGLVEAVDAEGGVEATFGRLLAMIAPQVRR